MKLKFFTTLLFFIGILLLQATATDLFFSEYVEGESQYKALEIFNGTGEAVDLSSYRISMAVNGGGWAFYHEFPEDATIADNDVWVIINTGANNLLDIADESGTFPYPGPAGFSGDDARGLEKKLSENEWELIDVIGDPDADVDGWDVAGVSNATLDHTIVRNADIGQGSLDWTNSSNTQWTVYEVNTFSYLGEHYYNGGIDETSPVASSTNVISSTEVELIFSETLDETSATNLANYSVTPDLSLTGAVLNYNRVVLTTSEQTGGEEYFITINNVEDLAGNQIAANSEMQFTGYIGAHYDAIADIQNNLDDYEGQQVTIHGIVMIGDDLLYPGRTKIYVQDESGRGIQIFDFDPPSETRLRGDEVVVTGSIELYTGSSGDYYDVQLSGDDIEILSSDNPLYDGINLTQNFSLDYNGTWAYSIGTITDVWVFDDFIQLKVDNGTLEVPVMFWNSTGADVTGYELGNLVRVQGAITYYRGSIQLLSGYNEDIEIYVAPVEPIKAKLNVEAKPFSPRMGQSIKIESNTGSNNKMILRIYNSEGKLVATPVNKLNTAVDGIDILNWDGKDKHGHILPIGMYICHLEVIEVSSGKKKTATAPIVVATKLK